MISCNITPKNVQALKQTSVLNVGRNAFHSLCTHQSISLDYAVSGWTRLILNSNSVDQIQLTNLVSYNSASSVNHVVDMPTAQVACRIQVVAGVTVLRTPSLVFVWKVILITHKLVSSTLLWTSEMSKLYCEIHL